MAEKIKVLKRDSSIEDFMPEKIARVVKAAGIEADEARLLAGRVAARVDKSGQKSISSRQIRDKVLEELRKVNKYAANLFEWYEKTKKKQTPQI